MAKHAIREFPMYVPNSAGSVESLAVLTSLAASQTFPLLSELLVLMNKGGPAPVEIVIEDFTKTAAQRKASEELAVLFEQHGSDKSTHHNYHHIYGAILEQPSSIEVIVEIGLGTNNASLVSTMGAAGRPGASLRAFADYAKNALIFGADIDKAILFSEERIRTAFVDQTDPKSFAELDRLLPGPADLIIDDGLHATNANLATLLFAVPRLKRGGWIVIEDIPFAALPIWKIAGMILGPNFASYIIKAKGGYLFAAQNGSAH